MSEAYTALEILRVGVLTAAFFTIAIAVMMIVDD